jgi:hypothetical protein
MANRQIVMTVLDIQLYMMLSGGTKFGMLILHDSLSIAIIYISVSTMLFFPTQGI